MKEISRNRLRALCVFITELERVELLAEIDYTDTFSVLLTSLDLFANLILCRRCIVFGKLAIECYVYTLVRDFSAPNRFV